MLEIRRFCIALGYFTRIPVPAWVGWSSAELNRATRYFPLVGLLVGLAAAAALYGASLVLPWQIAVLLSMLTSLLMTGAFHEDGLADSADGFGGGWEKAQVLAIMKDSRIGTYGALALLMAFTLKFAALDALGLTALVALPVVHAASRGATLMLMASMRYVREDDSTRAKPVAEELGATEWLPGALFGVLPAALAWQQGWLGGPAALAVPGACLVCTLLWGKYLQRRIGGYTGDALGACQQIAEISAYLVLCAMQRA